MRRIKVSIATAALLLAGAAAAQAADLPPPPMTPAAWSMSVFGGASWLDAVDFDGDDADVRFDFDTGFLVGGTIGYTFVDWARTELEIGYAQYDLDSVRIDGSNVGDFGGADLGVLTFMGNMWFGFNMLPVLGNPVNDAGAGLGFSPYFGGGLGIGIVDGAADGDDFDWGDSETGLAWQVGAGVRWNFASNIGLDLGYRFRNVSNVSSGVDGFGDADLSSQNVVVGLTFNF